MIHLKLDNGAFYTLQNDIITIVDYIGTRQPTKSWLVSFDQHRVGWPGTVIRFLSVYLDLELPYPILFLGVLCITMERLRDGLPLPSFGHKIINDRLIK